MAHKHTKRWSASLILTEVHANTCGIRTAVIKERVGADEQLGQEWGETGPSRAVGGRAEQPRCSGKWRMHPQKLKIEPPHDPVITLLAVNPKESKTGSQK